MRWLALVVFGLMAMQGALAIAQDSGPMLVVLNVSVAIGVLAIIYACARRTADAAAPRE